MVRINVSLASGGRVSINVKAKKHRDSIDNQKSLFIGEGVDAHESNEQKTPATRRTRAKSSDEPLVVPFTIEVDHRERQGGWTFQGITGGSKQKYRPLIIPTREIHMVTADYTAQDYDVYVERKSHDDFIGSITGGHHNLELEFERMRLIVDAGGYCCMIVESSMDRICDELDSPSSMRRATSSSVLGVVASWPQRFKVPILFAGTRRHAELLAFRTIEKYVEERK